VTDDESPEPDPANAAGFPATDDADFGTTGDAGATGALAKLLRRTPFLDLHERAGSPTDHRLRGWLCFCLDLGVRIVVVLLILSIIGALAWKTLAPLPQLRP
jgi:hypothetical protein